MSTHTVTQRYAQIPGAGMFTTIGRRVLAVALTFASVSVTAANRVEDISYASTPDGATEVTIKLAEPPAAPRAFATEAPPRIAVDLEDTRNALTERRINIGSGRTEVTRQYGVTATPTFHIYNASGELSSILTTGDMSQVRDAIEKASGR